jgi:2-oxoglutarate ferredoxin oxidoreductase subunit gamma
VTDLLGREALRQAVADSVPPAFQELNLRAFDKGFEYGSQMLVKLAENGDSVEALSLESA